MSLITSMRRQKAVWWSKTGVSTSGRSSFDLPVEVDCRWEDTSVEVLLPGTKKVNSEAVVYVDRLMKVGDRLLKGEMDSNTPNDPLGASSVEIKKFEGLPSFSATETLYTAYL